MLCCQSVILSVETVIFWVYSVIRRGSLRGSASQGRHCPTLTGMARVETPVFLPICYGFLAIFYRFLPLCHRILPTVSPVSLIFKTPSMAIAIPAILVSPPLVLARPQTLRHIMLSVRKEKKSRFAFYIGHLLKLSILFILFYIIYWQAASRSTVVKRK